MDNQNASPKQALLDKLQTSTNILVTVSANPSVDQLAACLGLTLWLNKHGKHATAVFSGEVPSTLEFLQPDETLEKNTDSLRDFIISLDKSKADKLRYKVEDKVVKIFITPYRTSLSADDLEYSQGDFNVDMVIALGVSAQQDLDTAITAHGRILHDAAVATITTGGNGDLGAVNWQDTTASSLSELVVDLGNEFDQQQLDGQIATALLTGIVAETNRFSNDKTTPQTMSISAELMSAGANQQLVASKLDEPAAPAAASTDEPAAAEGSPTPENKTANDGTLEIAHDTADEQPPAEQTDFTLPAPVAEPPVPETAAEDAAPSDDNQASDANPSEENQAETTSNDTPGNNEQTPEGEPEASEPPVPDNAFTANTQPDDIMLDPAPDSNQGLPLLTHSDEPVVTDTSSAPNETLQPAPPSWMPPQPWLGQPSSDNPDDQPPVAPPDDQPSSTPAPIDDGVPPTPPALDLPDPMATDNAAPSAPPQPTEDTAPADAEPPVENDETLTQIEESVHSPHLDQSNLDAARDEVMKALSGAPDPNPEPIQALNAQSIDLNDQPAPAAPPTGQDQPSDPAPTTDLPQVEPPSTAFDPSSFAIINDTEIPAPAPAADPAGANVDSDLTGPVDQPFTLPLPQSLTPPPANPVPPTSSVSDPTAPPPVPPPLMPPGFPPAQ